MTTHTPYTPTPWKVDDSGYLSGADGTSIGNLQVFGALDRRNAAFIVQAVNSHAPLLEAAKEALDVIHNLHGQMYHISVGKGICEWKPCAQLRAAIEAVEGRNT